MIEATVGSITAAGYTLKTDLFYSTPQVEGHDGMLDITLRFIYL